MIGEESLGQLAIGEAVDTPGSLPSDAFGWFATLLSEYANSPVILAMIEPFAECVDPTANFDAFYDLVFNVDTAVGYGLDVWGRIVGVSRVLAVAGDVPYLGFKESSDALTFNEGIWYNGGGLTSNFALSDTAFRRLILAKALANICDGTIKATNQILINLFGDTYGNCYCTDGLDMTMTYTFGSTLSPVDFAIVVQSGVLPRPAGVTLTIVQ